MPRGCGSPIQGLLGGGGAAATQTKAEALAAETGRLAWSPYACRVTVSLFKELRTLKRLSCC
jgi:hypothetical protein